MYFPCGPGAATASGGNTAPAAGMQQGPPELSVEDKAAVDKAAATTARQAAKAAKKALEEKQKREKVLAHQKTVLRASAFQYDPLTQSTPPERKAYKDTEKPALRIGDYVHVASALWMKGPARDGGYGYIVGTTGYAGATKLTVRYTIDGREESDIVIDRVKVAAPFSRGVAFSPRRKRKAVEVFDPST